MSHIILRHPQRSLAYQKRGFFRHGMKFVHSIYNAADYVINDDLIAMGLEPILQGLYSDTYKRDDVVDTVYADIYEDQPEDLRAKRAGSRLLRLATLSPAMIGRVAPATDNMSGSGEGDLPAPAGHDYHFTPEYEGDADEQADAAAQDEHDISEATTAVWTRWKEGKDTSNVSDNVRDGGNRYRSDKQSNVAWNASLLTVSPVSARASAPASPASRSGSMPLSA